MAELEELQKELREILLKKHSYDGVLDPAFSGRAAIIIETKKQVFNEDMEKFVALGLPSSTFPEFLERSIIYNRGGFYYIPFRAGWIDTYYPVDKALFDKALEELVIDRDSTEKQELPDDKATDFYSLLIDYFEKGASNLDIREAIEGKTDLDRVISTLEELKQERPTAYCQKMISITEGLLEEIEKCDYENKEQLAGLKNMMKRAKKLGINTEALEIQVGINKSKDYIEFLWERHQVLPAKMEKLREENPEEGLAVSKILEQRAKQIIKNIEAKKENLENIMRYLNFFEKCGIQSEEVKNQARAKFNKVEKRLKKKLRKVSNLKKDI